MTNSNLSLNSYELMENDKGEIMVLLYAGKTKPQKPTFSLYENEKCLELIRNEKDVVTFTDLQPESMDKLKKIKNLYICEMQSKQNKNTSDDKDEEIVYAYVATLNKEKLQYKKQAESNKPEKLN